MTGDYLLAAGNRYRITIAVISFGPDHCHIFAVHCKNHSPAKMANLLKGFSSYMMRKHHANFFKDKLYGKKFWSGGYFYRSVGIMNAETAKRYVEESQEKHWNKEDSKQRKLVEF